MQNYYTNNLIEVIFVRQISYPHANGASQNDYFQPKVINKLIIGVKVDHRQTDRQINSLTPYTGVCGFFLSIKYATSLLASLAGGFIIQIDKDTSF